MSADLAKDPVFKRYATTVDRALAVFDTLLEWPDYIAFLGRLLKALQSYPTCRTIPSKMAVASRLSQCLNPTLPSGVHQKTLEVYSFIFSQTGQTALAEDLRIWLPGLLPLFKYASLTLRPYFLTLFETFIVPLGASIRPAEKAIILALLPGMEEEHGEFFERTLSVIDQIRLAVKDEEGFFWQCLWLSIASSEEQRLGAYNYCLRRMENVENSKKAETLYVYPDPGLFIRAFSAGLTDSDTLVQRGFLELLLKNVPLTLPFLQNSQADLELLLISAVGVVLRRDMSLNKRLYIWLLGPESQSTYFCKYALGPLTDGLKKLLIQQGHFPPDPIRVSKIALALQDKWEIGGCIAPAIFTPVMESVSATADSAAITSARAFFDSTEPAIIWAGLIEWIDEGRVVMLDWVIDNFNLREEEMLIQHVPQVLLHILCLLYRNELQGSQWFVVARKLVQLLPSRVFTASEAEDVAPDLTDPEVNDLVRKYYNKIRTNVGIDTPKSESIKGTYFQKHLLRLFRSIGEPTDHQAKNHTEDWIALLRDALRYIPPVQDFDLTPVLGNLRGLLIRDPDNYKLLSTSIEATIALVRHRHIHTDALQPLENYQSSDNQLMLISSTFIHLLWRNLAADRTAHHVESVNYIWSFTTLLPTPLVETLLSKEVEPSFASDNGKAQACANFAVLWRHAVDKSGTAAVLTKTMMLILQFLKGEEGSLGRTGVERWLASLGNSAHRMFDIIFTKLLEDSLLRCAIKREYKDTTVHVTACVPGSDDMMSLSYHLDLLLQIFQLGNRNLWAVCADDKAVMDPSRLELLETNGLPSIDMTYAVLLIRICLRALFVEYSSVGDTSQIIHLNHLHRIALRVIKEVLSFSPSVLSSDIPLGSTLLKKLYMTIDDSTQQLQTLLMEIILSIFRLEGGMKSLSSPSLGTSQRISRQRSITGKKAHLKENLEEALGPTSLLLHMFLDAFSSPGARPIISTWSDFFMECLPYFSSSIFPILIPTVDCIVREIGKALLGLQAIFQYGEGEGDNLLEQCLTLLNLLEGVVIRAHEVLRIEESKFNGKGAYDGAGFLNNVMSGMWGGDGANVRSGVANNRLTVLLCMHDLVRLCYNVWSWDERLGHSEKQDAWKQSCEYTSVILKDTSRRIMQKVHAFEQLECFEVLIEIWANGESQTASHSVFGLIKILNSYKDNQIFSLFIDALNSRTNSNTSETTKRSSLSTSLNITNLLEALVIFTRQIELSSISEIHSEYLSLLKDCISNITTFRNMLGALLRLSTVYGEKLENTVIADKKKMRKDFGELYLRLLTLSFNQPSPHSRATSFEARVNTLQPNDIAEEMGDELKMPHVPSQEFLSVASLDKPSSAKGDTSQEILYQLRESIVPKLNMILDQEKVLAACGLIVSQIIGPVLRKRQISTMEPDHLDLLLEITRVPGSSKSWKREVYDAFNENSFFLLSPEQGSKWKVILSVLVANDKERIGEYISRVSAATSSILRSSRDQDRLINVRRLAFIIIGSTMDQFVASIGSIKEKLMELGRTASIDPIHGEVFLLYRALMLRFSPTYLVAFWPLMISEIQSLFSQVLDQAGIISKELLPLFFEACKVLDMMLVIKSENFQLQEWVFITDTIEAVYRSPNSHTSALVDRLAIRMGSGVNVSGSRGNSFSEDDIYGQAGHMTQSGRPDYRPMRKPIIQAKICQNVTDLIPFLSHLSVVIYESSYALSGPVDMEACDRQVLDDIFREG